MSAAATATGRPGAVYRRQTPTVWQAVGCAIWDALHATGQRRAARELDALARRWADIDPALAAQLRSAAHSAQHDTKELEQ